jgi:hypothetical protein
MSFRKLVSVAAIVAVLCAAADTGADARQAAAAPRGAGPRVDLAQRCDRAIDQGVHFLLSQQAADGSWPQGFEDNENYIVGQTALVTLALLSCDQSHQSPALIKALAFLEKAKPRMTYAVALRAAAFSQLPEPARPRLLRADLQWLLSAVISHGDMAGMYTYHSARGEEFGDFSNSQYGALGVWYAADAGLEVPFSYWHKVETAWEKGQSADGGWPYHMGENSPYASMTAAGVATLYITHDYLHTHDTDLDSKTTTNVPLQRGIQWLSDHFAVDHNVGLDPEPGSDEPPPRAFGRAQRVGTGTFVNYMLFGFERVGEATGLTRLGTHEWFDEGADYLCAQQQADGSWVNTNGAESDTAYSLLFLSRGLSPVIIQKLQFGKRWDNRPRDVSALVRFMRHATERHVNWQILDVDAPAADWRQSSIVYLASDQPAVFTTEQKAALREYVDQGGLVLAANEGLHPDFANSIKSLAAELFPEYPMTELPKDDAAFTLNYPTDDSLGPVLAVSNGVRKLLILVPSNDLPKRWQVVGGAPTLEHTPYGLAGNLLLYATDSANPEHKGIDHWIERDPDAPHAKRQLHVLRLKYDGNWDPEPGSWQRLANLLHNQDSLDLTIDPVQMNSEPLAVGAGADLWIAHLTTTAALTDAQIAGLKSWLDAGALVVMDSAGGSAEAGSSFLSQIARLEPAAKVIPLAENHPIYTGHFPSGSAPVLVTYRRSALARVGRSNAPRLKAVYIGPKLIAIESDEDLSAAMAGVTAAGIVGYSPATATNLMRNLVLWYAAGEPAPASTMLPASNTHAR